MSQEVRVADIWFAVFCSAFFTIPCLFFSSAPWPLFGTSLLICALLALRRTHPTLSSLSILTVCAAQAVILREPIPADVVILLAVFSAAAYAPRWTHLLTLFGGLVGSWVFALLLFREDSSVAAAFFVLLALLNLLAWSFGRVRASRLATLRAAADREAARQLSKEQDAELAVAAERARIAREMHDIVAHSLAVIISQADGGRYAAQSDPAQGIRALETISDIGRGALADIRRILGVLRSEEADGALIQPQPTSQDLAEVIERVRATGASVAFTVLGAPRALLPGMGLTLQRVCQEALTNSLKHAGPEAKMAVLLSWEEHRVVLQIDDDGRGAAALNDGTGTGILGMRERAQLFGGTLNAHPRVTGGFRVSLVLPLPNGVKEEA